MSGVQVKPYVPKALLVAVPICLWLPLESTTLKVTGTPESARVIEMLKQKKHNPGAISPLTLIEILRGIESRRRTRVKHLLEESFSVISIDNSTIEAYCDLYMKLKKEGNLLPDTDLITAASAMAHDLALVTNHEHFKRLRTRFKNRIAVLFNRFSRTGKPLSAAASRQP
jgi:predicted nucleic acid-binding protein